MGACSFKFEAVCMEQATEKRRKKREKIHQERIFLAIFKLSCSLSPLVCAGLHFFLLRSFFFIILSCAARFLFAHYIADTFQASSIHLQILLWSTYNISSEQSVRFVHSFVRSFHDQLNFTPLSYPAAFVFVHFFAFSPYFFFSLFVHFIRKCSTSTPLRSTLFSTFIPFCQQSGTSTLFLWHPSNYIRN